MIKSERFKGSSDFLREKKSSMPNVRNGQR